MDLFFMTSHYSINKRIFWFLQNQHQTHFKTSSFLTFTKLILLKYWHPLPEIFLWFFKVTFVQKVFWDVGHQMWMDIFYPLDLQDSYPHNKTSKTSAILFNPQWFLHMLFTAIWEVLRQSLNSCKKVNAALLFSCSWLGAYNFQNQILEQRMEN